jgi:group II intron reverse transcriptase/maturase
MYVATKSDRDWLLTVQRKLYRQSSENLDYVFRKLWGLVTDPHNLRMAFARVARNKGRRAAGVDGVTVGRLLGSVGAEAFVAAVRSDLRSGAYRPSPVRRISIPKPGKPGKFRDLGIPSVTDRVVQAAVKNIMEPIFEADFYPVSYGFRPGRRAHGALAHLRLLMRPKDVPGPEKAVDDLPYQVAVEGDIKGCFDNISHHGLMNRVRRRIGDMKVNRLVLAFLKAGILAEGQFLRSEIGTPQGGILSPLLANIALSVIEERYERHVWPRRTPTTLTDRGAIVRRAEKARGYDRCRGRLVAFPIRYADDFIILIGIPPGPEQERRALEAAHQEKAALAAHLKEELNLELSEAKTLVTPVTHRLRFLGHHVRVRLHPSKNRRGSTTLIPKERSQRLRELIKAHLSSSTTHHCLARRLRLLNPVLRGWANFYRHAWGAKRVFTCLDHYLWWTILRWLRRKHPQTSMRQLAKRYGWRKPAGRMLRWQDEDVRPFSMAAVVVEPFRLAWQRPTSFTVKSTESPVHNERCTPGSGKGAS